MNEVIEQHPSLLPPMQCEDEAKEKHLTNKLEKDRVPCKCTDELLHKKISKIWLSKRLEAINQILTPTNPKQRNVWKKRNKIFAPVTKLAAEIKGFE